MQAAESKGNTEKIFYFYTASMQVWRKAHQKVRGLEYNRTEFEVSTKPPFLFRTFNCKIIKISILILRMRFEYLKVNSTSKRVGNELMKIRTIIYSA